ncbi:MAG: ATP-binding protein [Deltaproteobacteria bacterium]|nr:ATP-binding protein [Deltaproteobacteria bacterium]MBW2339043.1 ATP-binding protein [Deltaproteobacteria bacterium]
MPLNDFNPWWKTSSAPKNQVGKIREILGEILSFLDYRQIIILYGLRRSGKTTLMYQIIDHLLRERDISPFRILYFSFDEQAFDLNQLIDIYQQDILRQGLEEQKKIYLFLDEIQKHYDWFNKIKIIYDRYPNLKIILSGSAALVLKKDIKESLAGRFFEFCVESFSFDEFIAFKGISIDRTREDLYKREIVRLLEDYLKIGGFIEAVNFDDFALKKYFRESLLERVVFRDIPEAFTINRPQLLFRLLQIVADIPGIYLDYRNLGNDLKVDQRTISNYISYLDYSLLITKLYNFSKNRLTSEKKLKRIYLSNAGFMLALRPGESEYRYLLEGYFANLFKAQFFYRSPQKEEVDLILESQRMVLPVEIKIRQKIKMKDLKPLIRFMKRFRCKQALIISKDIDRIEKIEDLKLTILPYWRYWSIVNEIKGYF